MNLFALNEGNSFRTTRSNIKMSEDGLPPIFTFYGILIIILGIITFIPTNTFFQQAPSFWF